MDVDHKACPRKAVGPAGAKRQVSGKAQKSELTSLSQLILAVAAAKRENVRDDVVV